MSSSSLNMFMSHDLIFKIKVLILMMFNIISTKMFMISIMYSIWPIAILNNYYDHV